MKSLLAVCLFFGAASAQAGICESQAKQIAFQQLTAAFSSPVRITAARQLGSYNEATTEEWLVKADVFVRGPSASALQTDKVLVLKASEGCRNLTSH